MNTTKREKNLKELVLGKCWDFINDNFHKFSEANKIKVALALIQKSMPTEIEGVNLKNIVVMGDIKKREEPLRFNIGQADPAEDPGYPGQAAADYRAV